MHHQPSRQDTQMTLGTTMHCGKMVLGNKGLLDSSSRSLLHRRTESSFFFSKHKTRGYRRLLIGGARGEKKNGTWGLGESALPSPPLFHVRSLPPHRARSPRKSSGHMNDYTVETILFFVVGGRTSVIHFCAARRRVGLWIGLHCPLAIKEPFPVQRRRRAEATSRIARIP